MIIKKEEYFKAGTTHRGTVAWQKRKTHRNIEGSNILKSEVKSALEKVSKIKLAELLGIVIEKLVALDYS